MGKKPLRIRDFIITGNKGKQKYKHDFYNFIPEDWIFSVVGYEMDKDENEIACLLRYVPDKGGERVSERGCFRKLSFSEAYDFLMTHHPEYIKEVHKVPKEDIKEVLKPNENIEEIAEREEKVRLIYDFLRSHIPKKSIGVTGSFLCALNSNNSDMDFVIYGIKNFNKAREVIEEEKGKKEGFIFPINDEIWKHIYNKRKPELSYEEFVAHEKRKKNRGLIGIDQSYSYFDVLYVRDWKEVKELDKSDYEKGEKVGYAKIIAKVRDATFSFDSPAIYEIEHPEIKKVLSFTHTYAGQALEGEILEAKGMIERGEKELRLVVGTTREAKGEWIKSMSLNENSCCRSWK